VEVRPIWFDSLGAKSSCVLVRTPDLSLLIDPGAAIMHPTYPASDPLKEMCWQAALGEVFIALKEASHIAITHYHLDHYQPAFLPVYRDKTMWVKDPNRWINASQWQQARRFLYGLGAGGVIPLAKAGSASYENPVTDHGFAGKGSAEADRRDAWKRTFDDLCQLWQSKPSVDEAALGSRVSFADGRFFRKGQTSVRFTQPMFHGEEGTCRGWVVGVVVTHGERKLVYTSDLQGPVVEDYAQWIIDERPDMLILDGPALGPQGRFQKRETADRAMSHCAAVVREAGADITVLDHHTTRVVEYRTRAADAYACGAVTGAELLDRQPLAELLRQGVRPRTCARTALVRHGERN